MQRLQEEDERRRREEDLPAARPPLTPSWSWPGASALATAGLEQAEVRIPLQRWLSGPAPGSTSRACDSPASRPLAPGNILVIPGGG